MLRLRETVALALVAMLGCEVGDFDVVRRKTVTIPADDSGEDIEIMELDDLEIVLAEIEDTQDIGREDLSAAVLDRLTLEVLEPVGADLAFAERIEVFAEAPGLDRVRVASQTEFPRGDELVELELDDVDLRKYVAAASTTFVAQVGGVAPPIDVRVKATATLHIGVTLRGACDHM